MSHKLQALINAAILLGILVAINVISSYVHSYIDLTEDKRFTLTDASTQVLEDLDEPVFVKVLLEGQFPAGFKRLRNATEDMIKDMIDVNSIIDYDFEDPNQGDPETRKSTINKLKEKGISPMRLTYVESDQRVDRLTFPYAIISYGPRTAVVNLLEEQVPGVDEEVTINNSISLLEYKLVSTLHKLRSVNRRNILLTSGQGEIDSKYLYRLEGELRRYYNTTTVDLDSIFSISQEISLVMVAGPRSDFDQNDQFKLDQYVMNGGKVIWLIDQLGTRLDSIAAAGGAYSPPVIDHGLDELFFKYGVRVEPNAIMDYQCTTIPQVIGRAGGKPQMEQRPWFFHPLISATSDHPISKNIAPVNMYFPSTVTVLDNPDDVKYTTLLSSSTRSRYKYVPMQLSTSITQVDAKPELFNKPPQPVAILAEGTFRSAFRNRVTSDKKAILENVEAAYKESSEPTSMLWVSDSDFIKNRVDTRTNMTTEIGYNRWTGETHRGNKAFILNAVEYLVDEGNILEARAKDVKLRLLDAGRTRNEKHFWQMINIGLPLVLLAIFGAGFNLWRRRKYARV